MYLIWAIAIPFHVGIRLATVRNTQVFQSGRVSRQQHNNLAAWDRHLLRTAGASRLPSIAGLSYGIEDSSGMGLLKSERGVASKVAGTVFTAGDHRPAGPTSTLAPGPIRSEAPVKSNG